MCRDRAKPCPIQNKMSKILTRKSQTRLKGYDYSQSNYYFITTCAENHKEWFGKIKNNEMVLNSHGQICRQHLENLPNYYNNIEIGTFIIMPNHVHAIIIIGNHNSNKLSDIGNGQALGLSLHNLSLHNLSLHNLSLHNQNKSLSKIIGDFKSFSSREINKNIKTTETCRDKPKACPKQIPFKWQRSFYDHITRNEKSLQKIREYIISNPANWADDEENIDKNA